MNRAYWKWGEVNRTLYMIITLLVMPAECFSATTRISDVIVTDVSDRSMSLIFTISEPATPGLKIFTDEGASIPVPSVEMDVYPVHTGDPSISGQFRKHSQASIVNSAKGRGIVKISASGLEPETTYYLRPQAIAQNSGEVTVCPDAGSELCDDVDPESLAVTTNKGGLHTFLNGSSNPQLYINDQLVIDTETGIEGDLVIVAVEGSQHPVSAFVGDGVAAPKAIIDLNNLYSDMGGSLLRVQGSSYVAERGNFGESSLVRLYRGTLGKRTSYKGIGAVSGSGEVIAMDDFSLGDCNLSGSITSYDQLLLNWVINNNPEPEFQRQIAFHPPLCNLFKEQGLNSLSMTPEINQEDLIRLKQYLIGSLSVSDIPEEPNQ